MFKESYLLKQEKEKEIQTKVVLEFMRHGKKDKDDSCPDEEIRLSEEGRQMSKERGESIKPQKEVSLARGSQFMRAQETILHVMLPEIDVNATKEEIEKIISDELKVGKKLIIDSRLGYNLTGPSGEETNNAFLEKRYISYVINESDDRAIEMNDKISTSYTRYVGSVAEIIYQYLKAGQNFNRIASKTDKYEKYGNQMERYLGTHSGISEFFIAKIIEKTKGIEKRDEFVKEIGSGFKETEGMTVEIVNQGKNQEMTVKYHVNGKKEELKINEDLLLAMIEERKEFEQKINLAIK
jgi:hypothetical protein